MNLALSVAHQGIKVAVQQQAKSARRIANIQSNSAEGDLAQEMVNQIESEHNLAANVVVAKTADSMLGRIIDLII